VFSQEGVRNYEIEVDPQDWAHLNETAYLEEYIPARLTFEGDVYEIALRFKGFRGSLYSCFTFDDQGNAVGRRCDRLPLKVSFDHYDEEARFFGLKKLNFHVLRNDPSLMRDRLSYAVFRASGVPAPRAVHATLSVNGEALGLYGLVEQVDGRFARNAFEDGGEGNIYKERWPTSSTDADYFVSGLESNKDVADVSAMQAFAEDVQAATDATIEDVLREHTNFDGLMRYLAVDRAIHHWDGPLAFRCRTPDEVPALPPKVLVAQTPALGWQTCQNKNYFWYEELDSGKLWLVPWDMDFSWNSFSQFPDWNTPPETCEIRSSGRTPRCDPLVNWFATTVRPRYAEAGRELLTTGPLRQPVSQAWLDRWYAQIAPHAEPATLAFGAFLLGAEIQNRLSAFTEEVSH
jgi:spore coat protein CotH